MRHRFCNIVDLTTFSRMFYFIFQWQNNKSNTMVKSMTSAPSPSPEEDKPTPPSNAAWPEKTKYIVSNR